MKTIEGNFDAKGLKIALVASRFNELITSKLIQGAQDCLVRHGMKDEDIDLVWVPGAYEIPLTSGFLAKKGIYDGIIALGAVIRGATTHYDLVASEVTKGIASVSLESGVPVLFGVITTESIEQALERAGTKSGNKGWDAALGAIEMANLKRKLS